jgi:cell division protein FtsZ
MSTPHQPVIKIFGLGGGGSNAVNRMIELGLEGVDFIAANTDAQALKQSLAATRLQLGPGSTRGLGAGGRPEIGETAAAESRKDIQAALQGADLVFLTAGMGGGTGTGAIAIAAEVARGMGILTVGIVTTPFTFEASRRRNNAEWGLARLRPQVDMLITVPNDKLLPLLGRSTTFEMSLRVADEVLRQGVQGLTELISKPGLINVDFANVRSIITGAGTGMMAIGQGRGEHKAEEAVQQALKMPLIDSPHLEAARGILVHFTGGDDLGLFEVSRAAEQLRAVAPNAEIVFGTTIDETMAGRTQVILIVTGYDAPPLPELPVAPASKTTANVVQTQSLLGDEAIPVAAAVLAPTSRAQAAHGNLAEALFRPAFSSAPSAVAVADAIAEPHTIIASEPKAANPNDLDIPAFLRRRRSLRDFKVT